MTVPIPPGGIPVHPGDLLLTTKLVLVVIDTDLEEKGLEGRRLSDGLPVQVPREAVYRIFHGNVLAPIIPGGS